MRTSITVLLLLTSLCTAHPRFGLRNRAFHPDHNSASSLAANAASTSNSSDLHSEYLDNLPLP